MATKSIAWNTGSGNITLTYQGQGDGIITVQSDPNNLGSSRSQTITVKTVGGAITRNLTVSQAACSVPVGTVLSYSYTGSYQEVTLPAGQYKLQCWGAQGGSNAAASSYSITAKAGGKGGYSESVITLSQPTVMRIYVGGQGSSSAGGFNGGGSTTGSSTYSTGTSGQDGYELGVSRMGGGGGATDIRLSDGALLSRMIVAGGGSGGAMCYKKKTTSSSTSNTMNWRTSSNWGSSTTSSSNIYWTSRTGGFSATKNANWPGHNTYVYIDPSYFPCKLTFSYTITGSVGSDAGIYAYDNESLAPWSLSNRKQAISGSSGSVSVNLTDSSKPYLGFYCNDLTVGSTITVTSTKITYTTTSTTTSNDSQVGYVGGGSTGNGYSDTYKGKQNAAGSGGSFGQGANQTATNYRYCSGAGGGGWYGGGGGQKSDSDITYCKYSGGGSGWVNIAANASNRPSGYTGLELDSGTTYAGDTSFPNTAGTGNETGHSGNGYAKITRLA